MFNLGKQPTLGHAVASQLISHNHARDILKALQQPSKEALRGFGVSPWLNKDVAHYAVLIRGTPKIVLHAFDPDEHLVYVPLVSRPWSAASQAAREGLAKLLAPLTNRLIGDNHVTFSQKQLNIPRAEAEHVTQPDSMADDLIGGSDGAAAGRAATSCRQFHWSPAGRPDPVNVTIPSATEVRS
jgi:hypothetical protein